MTAMMAVTIDYMNMLIKILDKSESMIRVSSIQSLWEGREVLRLAKEQSRGQDGSACSFPRKDCWLYALISRVTACR